MKDIGNIITIRNIFYVFLNIKVKFIEHFNLKKVVKKFCTHLCTRKRTYAKPHWLIIAPYKCQHRQSP